MRARRRSAILERGWYAPSTKRAIVSFPCRGLPPLPRRSVRPASRPSVSCSSASCRRRRRRGASFSRAFRRLQRRWCSTKRRTGCATPLQRSPMRWMPTARSSWRARSRRNSSRSCAFRSRRAQRGSTRTRIACAASSFSSSTRRMKSSQALRYAGARALARCAARGASAGGGVARRGACERRLARRRLPARDGVQVASLRSRGRDRTSGRRAARAGEGLATDPASLQRGERALHHLVAAGEHRELRHALREIAFEDRQAIGLVANFGSKAVALGDDPRLACRAPAQLFAQRARRVVDRLRARGEGGAVVVEDTKIGACRVEVVLEARELPRRFVALLAQRIAFRLNRVQRIARLVEIDGQRRVVLVPGLLVRARLLDLGDERLQVRLRERKLGILRFGGGTLVLERLGQARDRRSLVLEIALRLGKLASKRLLARGLVGKRVGDAADVVAQLGQRLVDACVAAFVAVGARQRLNAVAHRRFVPVARLVRLPRLVER